jgi:hypothetical protein
MSTVNNTFSNSNFSITNYDVSKMFVGENSWSQGDFTNSDYDDVTLAQGTLLGRIASTGEVVVCKSGASDGSQFPIGVLANTVTVAAGDTQTLTYCISGDVIESKIVFDGTDTLATVVSDKTFRDRIAADTAGIVLVATQELTDFDNQ